MQWGKSNVSLTEYPALVAATHCVHKWQRRSRFV